MNLKIDHYETLKILGTARSGPIQLEALCSGLAGTKEPSAQIRILFELIRRGRVTADDLVALAARDRKVSP
jgi:hypothetical protein